jgi:hypothetical protein
MWYGYYQILPKNHRYTLGQKIDTLFIELLEMVSIASFTRPTEKQHFIEKAVQKADTIKILLMMLWETKSLDNKKYIALSTKLNEVGKMLGGWNGHLKRQNSPDMNRGRS